MRNCTICNEPIILVPSAKERAEKYGKTPKYYTDLFRQHDNCIVAKRNQETIELMRIK